MSRLKFALHLFAGRLLSWCVHPKWRAACLRRLGANIGAGVRVHDVRLINPTQGYGTLSIGAYSLISDAVTIDLTGPVRIGSHSAISPGCLILSHSDPGSMIGSALSKIYPRQVRGVTVGDHVWIGAGTILLDGVTVADHTVIGAGSIVTKNIPSGVVACGRPARPARGIMAGSDRSPRASSSCKN